MNKTNIEKLIMLVRANKKALPYVNIDSNGNYAGWVSDFHIVDKQTGKSVCLNYLQSLHVGREAEHGKTAHILVLI